MSHYTHLGAHLKSLREHYELDVPQVAAHLHIRPKYIEAIETGDMSALPGKVYTQGYIQAYAEFLGLDAATVLRDYAGLSGIGSAGQFRIVEPTRQAGMPAWRLIVAAAGTLLLLYVLIDALGKDTQMQAPLQSRIQPVPDRLKTQVSAPLILTERNAACLQIAAASSVMPCYYEPETSANISSIMELVP